VSQGRDGTIAPGEAAMQPAVTTATDTASSVSHDLAGAIAPVEVAAQSALTATDTAASIPPTVLDTIVADEGSRNQASDPLHAADQAGSLAAHASTNAAPDVGATEPLTTAAATAGPTSDVSHPADGTVASDALANAAPDVGATEPLTTAAATAGPTSDVSHPADGTVASDALANAAPDVGATEPLTTTAASASPTSDVSHPADTIIALATATNAPIQVPESATAAPADTAAPVHPTAVAGDVIALNDAQPSPADTLFTGTEYTQYGVTLSSHAAASPQHAASSADAASAQDTSAPAVADAPQHTPPPPDIVDPTYSIDQHVIL
jgi:hypothetical protein